MTKPGICPGGSSQESGWMEESETCTVKGLLGHTKDFGLYSVSGVETLKHVTRYAQCEGQPNPNSTCSASPIPRPTRRGMLVVQSLSRVRLLRPRGLYPARLLCPWDFPGKNIGAGFATSFSRGSFQLPSPVLQVDSLPAELPGNTQRNSSHLQLHNLQIPLSE